MTLLPESARSLASGARVLGLAFDRIDIDALIDAVRARLASEPFAYIVTPNVDHMVRLRTESYRDEVHQAYAQADATVCDSKVLRLLAMLRGVELTLVSGSDVSERLLERERGCQDAIVLIGGDARTVPALQARFGLGNVIQHIPPMGLLDNDAAIDAAARFIRDNPARFVFIAVGSPQQEVVALRTRQLGGATGVGLCIGASIDYLTGRAHRAPRLMRLLALEWLYRLIREPRRLWRRYLVRSPKIFLLMARDRQS